MTIQLLDMQGILGKIGDEYGDFGNLNGVIGSAISRQSDEIMRIAHSVHSDQLSDSDKQKLRRLVADAHAYGVEFIGRNQPYLFSHALQQSFPEKVKLLRAVSNFLEAKDIDLEKFIGGLQNKDGKPMPNVMTWDANLDEYVFDSENISHEDLIRIIAKANEYFGEPTAVQENLETSLQTYADTLQANFHARIEFEIGKADSIVEGFQSRMDNTIRQSFFERVKKSFSEVFKSAWESLKTGLKEVVDVIVQQFEGLSEVANEVFYNMNGRPRPKSEAGSELEDLDTGLVVEETQAPEPVQTAAQRETTRSEGAGVIPISTSSESDSMFDALTSRDSGEVMGIAGSPSAPEGQDTVAQPLALSTENAYESEDVINFS